MAGRSFIDFQPKRPATDFQSERAAAKVAKRRADAGFILPHRLDIAKAELFRIMLRLAKAAIVAPNQDLHLLAPSSVSAEDVEIRIARHSVKRRLILLAVAYGTADAQIKRNGTRDGKAAANSWIDGRVDRSRPSAAGKPRHVKDFVLWKMPGAALALEIVQAQGCGFEEIFDRASFGGRFEHVVVMAGAIPWSHMRHEDTQHSVTFAQ